MKEATGETSMTMITLVAIGVIAAIMMVMWPRIHNWIDGAFTNSVNQGQYRPGGTTGGTTNP